MSSISATVKLSVSLMRMYLSTGRIAGASFCMAIGALLDVVGVSIVFILAKILTSAGQPVDWMPRSMASLDAHTLSLIAVTVAFVLYVSKFAMAIVNSLVAARVCFGVYERISTRLIDSYLRQPYEFHMGRNSSELTHNVHYVSLAIALTVILPTLTLFSEAFVVLLFASAIVWKSPLLSGIGIAILGAVGWVLVGTLKPLFTARGRAAHQAAQELVKLTTHTFGSIKEVKIYAAEKFFEKAHDRNRAEVLEAR